MKKMIRRQQKLVNPFQGSDIADHRPGGKLSISKSITKS